MPSRVNVYCRRSVDHVDAASIRRALGDADLYTMAEGLNFPEGDEETAVDAMRPHLRVDEQLDIYWKPDPSRPIQISIVSGPDAQGYLVEEISELEARDDGDSLEAQRVLAHLRECQSIVYLEMSLDAPETLCGVLAEVVAYHFATEGDGLIWFYFTSWAAPDDWSAAIWTTG